MTVSTIFTVAQRAEFLRRIVLFVERPDCASDAKADVIKESRGDVIALDGKFNYEAMVFAVTAPRDCVSVIKRTINSDYRDVLIRVDYSAPATLSMHFRVTCALTPRPSQTSFTAWIMCALLPVKA